MLSTYKDEQFFKTQESWKEEIQTQITQFKVHLQNRRKDFKLKEEQLIKKRETELKHIKDIRELYDRQLERVNQLSVELSAVLLQLEHQKQEGRKREMQTKRRLIQPFMKKLEKRRTSHISTTPTSPECSLTSPESPSVSYVRNDSLYRYTAASVIGILKNPDFLVIKSQINCQSNIRNGIFSSVHLVYMFLTNILAHI